MTMSLQEVSDRFPHSPLHDHALLAKANTFLTSGAYRSAAERDDLDLRRIEHALLEIRDGQRRLEDRLMRGVESGGAPLASGAGDGTPASLVERVTTRLLAQGFERVQVVTPRDELPEGDADGAVLVEAHRDGVLYKGRVEVRAGALHDVDMKPAYSAFP